MGLLKGLKRALKDMKEYSKRLPHERRYSVLCPFHEEGHPSCIHSVIDSQIRAIDEWFKGRPSATMDPSLDERAMKLRQRALLKSQKRKTVRRETKMMAAQQMSEFDAGDLPW